MICEQVNGLMAHSELIGLSASEKHIQGGSFPCHGFELSPLLDPRIWVVT